MSDEIEITLPVSGKKVTIRNYTTRADDLAYEAVLYKDVDAKNNKDGAALKIPIANVMDATQVYVYRLTKSVDGSTEPIRDVLESLRTPDYAALQAAVEKIVEANSPKANPAS